METTQYIATSRQAGLWRQLEVVANNMANANTPGYKAEEVMFKDYLVRSQTEQSKVGRPLAYVQDVGTMRDTREGPLSTTGAPLDVALHGDGYFVVDTPSGPRYTREGHFRLDETGMMVNGAGYPVMQKNMQPVIFAPGEKNITIAGDGTVSTENGSIGKLRVVQFDNEQQLQKVGEGTYRTDQEPTDVARPLLEQGMLEGSNVQPVIEMTKMMTILRNYEGVQKMVDGENDRISKAMLTLSRAQT